MGKERSGMLWFYLRSLQKRISALEKLVRKLRADACYTSDRQGATSCEAKNEADVPKKCSCNEILEHRVRRLEKLAWLFTAGLLTWALANTLMDKRSRPEEPAPEASQNSVELLEPGLPELHGHDGVAPDDLVALPVSKFLDLLDGHACFEGAGGDGAPHAVEARD